MKKWYLAGAATVLAFAAMPASAQNLLTNGSFEAGFAGWTVTTSGGTAPVVIAYNQASGYPTGAFGESIPTDTASSFSPDPVGNLFAYFSSDVATGDTISQTINLVAGRTYNLGFDYFVPQNGYNNPFDSTLSFQLNGVTVGSTLTAGSAPGVAPRTWLNFNTSFTATQAQAGAQTLSFRFVGGGVTAADFAIDRVYVLGAVPEPASWALMIAGFGLVGGAMRRRSTKVAFA